MAAPLFTLSLFSGGGGLDWGIEQALERLAGAARPGGAVARGAVPRVRSVAYVEREAFAAACLLARMEEGRLVPGPVHTDVCAFDGRPFRGLVDLVFGGSPCQDVSLAGKRQGLHGKKSSLFFQLVRIVEEVEPPLVFWENVGGAKKELPAVFAEFERLGYAGKAVSIRTADVGATHARQRIFLLGVRGAEGLGVLRSLVADGGDVGCAVGRPGDDHNGRDAPGDLADGRGGAPAPVAVADAPEQRAGPGRAVEGEARGDGPLIEAVGPGQRLADTDGVAGHERDSHLEGCHQGSSSDAENGLGCGCRCMADSDGGARGLEPGRGGRPDGAAEPPVVGHAGEELADPGGSRLQGGERPGTFGEDAGAPRSAPERGGAVERPYEWPRPFLWPPGPADVEAWRQVAEVRPDLLPAAQPGVRRVAHELAFPQLAADACWGDSLRLLGNGVVPAQVAEAFVWLVEEVLKEEVA